jgi:hypothetical protein
MTVAPPSRTMMPFVGNARVASTTKRAVCIGFLPLGADSASFANRSASSQIQRSRLGEAGRGVSLSQ